MPSLVYCCVTRDEVVQEARSWLGTPFVHQASRKGVGTDCAGLVRGVLRGLGGLPEERALPEAVFAYHRRADGVTLKRVCDEHLERVSEPMPGDVALIRFGKIPHHLGFIGDRRGLSLIHALGPMKPSSVVEHTFDEMWRSRVVGYYRIPGIA